MNQPDDTPTGEHRNPRSRWSFFRDLLVFQGKLFIDGLRDLVLVPVSLVAGLIDLVRDPHDPGERFYQVMLLGKQSEKWINLFGAVEEIHPEEFAEDETGQRIDDLVAQLERRVLEQHDKGGITAQAKRTLDILLDRMGERRAGKARTRPPEEAPGTDASGAVRPEENPALVEQPPRDPRRSDPDAGPEDRNG